MNKLRETVPSRGDIIVRTIDAKTGRVLRRYEIRNKIMNKGFAALVRLLADGYAGGAIHSIRVGASPTGPSAEQTALLGDVADLPGIFIEKSVEGPFHVIVKGTLPAGTPDSPYNGENICEAGLFLVEVTNNVRTMFARQVHPRIEKSTAIAIEYEWRIAFVPA